MTTPTTFPPVRRHARRGDEGGVDMDGVLLKVPLIGDGVGVGEARLEDVGLTLEGLVAAGADLGALGVPVVPQLRANKKR